MSIKVICENCGSDRVVFGIRIISSGYKTVIARCMNCGRRPQKNMTAYHVAHFNLDKLAVWENNVPKSEPCAKCGSTDGSQYHHWAPRSVFADAEEWPGDYLCPDCHKRWHVVIRDFNWKKWNGYR